ncbi:MAG TPA: hypothetical protein VMT03_22740 [Polyangia bacterium]|nr:hypothetical protein [Polyangia bacterium]
MQGNQIWFQQFRYQTVSGTTTTAGDFTPTSLALSPTGVLVVLGADGVFRLNQTDGTLATP